jgi:hypothetical protein
MAARGDEQIVEGQDVSFRRLLAFDLSYQVSCLECDWMEGHKPHQFIDVLTPALAHLRRPRAKDPVYQLGYRDRGQ